MPKKPGKWEKIASARHLLGLGEIASLAEIREAYRRKAKQNHPDLAPLDTGSNAPLDMHLLTEAYQTIVAYCQNCRIPLKPGNHDPDDDDDQEWWMKRFGQDPLWGRKRD